MYIFTIYILVVHQIVQTISQNTGNSQDTLIMIEEIFRHGHREMLHGLFDGNEYKYKWGELTNVGIRQHYVLGKILKKLYIDDMHFIDPIWNSSQIYVKSSDTDRTIMSVRSQLQGLFGQSNIYQPIPIHVTRKSLDKILRGYATDVCPVMKRFSQENQKSKIYLQIQNEQQPILQRFGQIVNESNVDIKLLHNYMDVFTVDYYSSPIRQIPQFTNQENQDILYVNNLIHQLKYYQTRYQIQLTSTPFNQDLLFNIEKAVYNRNQNYKWYMYSAHDTTISMILASYNLTSWQCQKEIFEEGSTDGVCFNNFPGYASVIIFELWKKSTNDYYIKLRANGTYLKICDNQAFECDLSEFTERVKSQFIDNYDEICFQDNDGEGNTNTIEVQEYESISKSETPKWASILLIIILIFNIILAVGFYYNHRIYKLLTSSNKIDLKKDQSGIEMNINL